MIIFLIIFSSCTSTSIQNEIRQNYLKDSININDVRELIIEINHKAINNDVDYFRKSAELYVTIPEEISEIELSYFIELDRQYYNLKDYSDDEVKEYVFVKYIEALIGSIIRANIVETFIERIESVSENEIHFNYCLIQKRVHFQMFISKMNTNKWKLDIILMCM